MVTRTGLVAKKPHFSPQNDDEIPARRQNIKFPDSKRRRDSGSSPKNRISRLKSTTRFWLVIKKSHFSPQNNDEIPARRQKIAFLSSKQRRDPASSPKNQVSRLKTTTRTGLVTKKPSFPTQNGDENRARHQKIVFLASM
jgi:hypothetical protein